MISSIRHASAPRLVTGLAIAGVAVAMLAAPAAAAPATQFAAAAPQANSICSSATNPRLAAHMSHGILAALNGRSSVVGLTVADPQYHLICKFSCEPAL
jgi:hypothetical protein